jgi:acyl dehydratase
MTASSAETPSSPRVFARLADLAAQVGSSIGTSDWIVVDQARIAAFAEATEDRQWIHLDADRAAAGPFGRTIAHGFLTLSLLPRMFETGFRVAEVRMGVNYGLDRVRFPSPVPAGSRVRGHFTLLAFEPLGDDGAQLKVEVTVEREGASKPACVAESLSRLYTRAP